MKFNIDEPVCESCGTLAAETWETDVTRSAVLRLSLEQPIHHNSTGWRILCNECEEGLQQIATSHSRRDPSQFDCCQRMEDGT